MKHQSREVWEERVRRLADSGLTTKEFAAELGINPRTLAWWKSRLSQKAALPSKREEPAFIDVTAHAQRVVGSRQQGQSSVEPFEVMFQSGVRIRVPVVFDVGALRSLVAALEVH